MVKIKLTITQCASHVCIDEHCSDFSFDLLLAQMSNVKYRNRGRYSQKT